MPNNPNAPITTDPNTSPVSSENQGEVSRQTAQEIGEKSNEQVYIEKLLAEREALVAKRDKFAELEQQLTQEIEQEEQNLANGSQSSATSNGEQTPATSEGEGDPQNKAEKTFNKAKKSTAFKAAIAATVVAAIALVSGAVVTWFGGNANQTATPDRPGVTDVADTDVTTGENQEAKGIYDGYGEKGMWLSDSKGGQYDFASAKEVGEVCDDDECEMIKYTSHNQVESYADYLANLPKELQPEGFKGLTILETEKKLEGLSDEEFEDLQQKFDGIIDNAFTRRVVVNGEQNNAYMRLRDGNGSVTHGNMELVACTTNESNLEVTQLYWVDKDGNEIGSMSVKMLPVYDSEENITGFGGCMQVISGDKHVYTGLTTITENPSTTPTNPGTPTNPDNPTTPPTTPPTNPPDETIKPKDPDNLSRIDEQIQDDIAEDIGTGEVNVTPNPGVSNEDLTDKPSSGDYQGTSPNIVQNDPSKDAEPVQGQVSPENDYSENRGGANSGEYAPVQDDQAAQNAADASEIPVDEAPTGGTELQDILGEMGIN